MKIKNLLVVLFLVISSFTFAQENPSPVEDGIVVRCPIGTKNVWNSVYIGSPTIRKNISLSIDSTVYGKTTKIAFKNSSGFPDTATGYYTLGSGIRQWKNRSSDYLYYKSDTTGAFWVNVEYTNGPSLEYGGLNKNEVINLIQTTSSDTTTYVPKYGDFTVEDTKTFRDSTILEGKIMNRGSATNRPMIRSFYGDVGTPTYVDVGQVGVGEFNATINFDYTQGLHWYYDTSRAAASLTMNLGADSILCFQWIPKGYGNQPSQPDAWALSGNTTPWRVNSQGFMGVIGGISSIFKRRGNPTFGTSTAYDYSDSSKPNFGGRGGKSFFDWKVGIGTELPATTFHTKNKATVEGTTNYGVLSDWILQDDGVSDRAQLELRSPNGSLIAFGNQSQYNSAYMQFVNSTSTFNIVSSIINLAGTVQENGTALTSKYSQLVQLDTLPKLNNISNTFSGNLKSSHLALGTSGTSPIPWLAVGVAVGDSNMIGLNLVNTTLNTTRNSQSQATDTSSASIRLTRWTGKPQLDFVDNTGATTFKIDSTGRTTAANTLLATSFTSTSSGGFQATAAGLFYFTGRSVIKSPADGTVTFTNNAESTGARLIFGTATLNNLPVYADNAAALSGGLTAGQIYRTSTGVLMVTY